MVVSSFFDFRRGGEDDSLRISCKLLPIVKIVLFKLSAIMCVPLLCQ